MSLRRLLPCACLVFAVAVVGCSRTAFTTDEALDGAAAPGTATASDSGTAGGGVSSGDDGSIVATSADGIDGVACAGKTCKDKGVECGTSDDGCGKSIDCGTCTQGGTTCVAGTCSCTPKTCADLPSVHCGYVSDGCGGNIACGSCPDSSHCTANVCTSTTCQPAIVMPGECGDPATNQIPNGCSSTHDGETCGADQTCGGGGTVNQCGCTRLTCEQAGAECGAGVSDGCGGQLSCGECAATPGACDGNHCDRCFAIPDASLGYEAKCAEGTLKHAWACPCSGSGSSSTCIKPDTSLDTSPSCLLLANTADHAVYCCTNDGATP